VADPATGLHPANTPVADPVTGLVGGADVVDTGRRPAAPPPPPPAGRTSLLTLAAVIAIAVVGTLAMVLVLGPGPGGKVARVVPSATAAAVAPPPSSGPPAGAGGGTEQTVSLSATGDIIMGVAPNALPANGGRELFADVRDALRADLQMGNLEQPLTNDTGYSKCPPPPRPSANPATPPPAARQNCFAFRAPPAYATVLREAGFGLVNLANNHTYDFGQEGYRQTTAALEAAGVRYTGAPGQITVVQVKGVRVAVVGFAPYSWSQDLTDVDAAAALVKQAADQADLVVVQMQAGAEGADKTRVRPGTETFLGENRGDPMKFAHAVVDAGADLVVGHGPHVMRGMEFYNGRLIAYSLGNFAGYRSLAYAGVNGVGGVLRVTLRKDGAWAGGTLVPTKMVAPGVPAPDPARQALPLVRSLSGQDFPTSGAQIGEDGAITPRG
jgi:hypothetical protein